MDFEKLDKGIHRLCIPFEDIYTSVFLLCENGKYALLDSATNESDVKNYILPALRKIGAIPEILICSHLHSDHCGGMEALAEAFPDAKIVLFDKEKTFGNSQMLPFTDGDILLDRFEILNLKGHSKDSLAVFDRETRTLLSCDCLQMRGITKYGIGVSSFADYKKTLSRVRSLAPSSIIGAHNFFPLGFKATGSEEVKAFLLECEKSVDEFLDFTEKNKHLAPKEISELYNSTHPGFPTVSENAVISFLREI